MRRKLMLSVSMLLAALMILGLFAGCKKTDDPTPTATAAGEATAAPADTATAAPEATEAVSENTNQIILGNSTELSGDWGNAWWTNNAADRDVRILMDGYATVAQTPDGEYVFDETVVAEQSAVVNEDDTKTYTIKINEDLVWNNGDPITAKNYVAYLLLAYSKVLTDMGAKVNPTVAGAAEYNEGTATVLSGVRLLDEFTFSVTIAADYLPYYYDITYASVAPLPIQMWLPEGFDVADDGEGAYFTGGTFDLATCQAAIENGRFLSTDRISCGPYNLISFDSSSLQAILEINDQFKGDYTGQKPSIEKVIYVKAVDETQFDMLTTGQIDVISSLTGGADVNTALDLEEQGGFKTTSYERNGYGKLMFQCDFGPTQFIEVRHAIAYLLDRNEFANTFCEGFGSVVHGPYGLAMWMYKDAEEDLLEKLDTYTYNYDSAVAKLEEGGWTLGADGAAYTTGIRYKEVTAEEAGDYKHNVTLANGKILMPLIIEWASSEGNPVSDLLAVMLAQSTEVANAGMQINQNVMTFTELLNYMYRDSSQGDQYAVKTYGMYNLATNFTPVYDLSYNFTLDPDFVAQGYNSNFIFDEQLDQLSMDMVYGVEAGDNEAYLAIWVDFVDRWNELLPEIPLYSNVYYDVYNDKFENYEVNSLWGVVEQLIYMSVK